MAGMGIRRHRGAMPGVWVHNRRWRRPLAARRRAVVVAAGTAGCAETALRVEQEHAGRNNALPFPEPLANLDPVRKLNAESHGTRLEAILYGNEYVLLKACVDDRVARHRHDAVAGSLEGR
jgi:hypothetical protein